MTDSKLRVMFLDSTLDWGGPQKWCVQTARALGDRNVEVTVGCRPQSELEARAKGGSLSTWLIRRSGWASVFSAFQLSSFLSTNQIEVIVAQAGSDLRLAALACALSGKRLVERRGLTRPIERGPLQRWIYTNQVSAIVGNCRAVDERMRQDASFIPADKFHVIPNGVSIAQPSKEESRRAREHFQLETDQFAVGVLARLSMAKGIHNLLGAWRIFSGRCPEARLLIAGTGELASGLADELARLGISDSVRLLGFERDPDQLLAALDLFVMPSIQDEGSSQAVLEAMALGLAAIVTNCGGLPELIESGRTGRVAPKNHADSLADALGDMFGDERLRQSMGERAREFVQRHHSVDAATGAWEQLLREVADSSS